MQVPGSFASLRMTNEEAQDNNAAASRTVILNPLALQLPIALRVNSVKNPRISLCQTSPRSGLSRSDWRR